MASTQPLRDEHAELTPHIAALAAAGDAVGRHDLDDLRAKVDASYDFLTTQLIPHAGAEDRALYPVVQRVLGAPEATATMSRDHVEVDRLTAQLGALRARLAATGDVDGELADDLRRVLYGLHALVSVHFAKEEEVYLPMLEARLTDAEAHEMFAAMHGDHEHHEHHEHH
ncbi:MAG: hemerythrin domain-containing protein, partial [Acidimicrobiales bacterium]|nr:hemerythrin domain-containing protein [Acidimicrobiales bacterium]